MEVIIALGKITGQKLLCRPHFTRNRDLATLFYLCILVTITQPPTQLIKCKYMENNQNKQGFNI
jgi:hypothetical protein